MTRGEVWWANLANPIGRRPVVLLSRRSLPPGRGEITVAYVTSHVRGLTVEVPLSTADGLPRACVVNLDSINTVPKTALQGLICTLSAAKMDAVKKAIIEALELN